MKQPVLSRFLGIPVLALALFAGAAPLPASDIRRPAMPFTLESLSGREVSLVDFGDTVLLVNFWASWCPPCVAELPSMQALKESMAGEPFEILALNIGENPHSVRRFIEHFETRLDFPILLRADQTVARDWKVSAMPTSALVDKQGRLAATLVGPRDWNNGDSRRLVRTLLDE